MKKFVVWGCKLHEHTNSYVYAVLQSGQSDGDGRLLAPV